MTTIAWDGSTLASDSQEQDDYIEQHASRKLYRIKNTLVGLAGCSASGIQFVEWVKRGEMPDERPKFSGDFCALVIRPNGKAYEYGSSLTPMPAGRKTAIGSGRGPALGALLAGVSARDAVKIAIKLDPNSGGPVKSLTRLPNR